MKIQVIRQLLVRHNNINRLRHSVWFIHGFGDSGLAYREGFWSLLNDSCNVCIVDVPGFGVSPIQADFVTMREQANLLGQVILNQCTHSQKVSIVGHSLGALIGTWICQALGDKVHCFFQYRGKFDRDRQLLFQQAIGI